MSNTGKAEEAKIAAVEKELAGDVRGAAQQTTTVIAETRSSGSSNNKQ